MRITGATVDFSGRVNRDQRDLALNFSATVQGGDYPHSLKADFTQLSWQLRGAELPPDGINGRGVCRPAGRKMTRPCVLTT
ncbi:AsmA protein [Klebsiella pneumoniae]|uniref:AsmA protein n=1 Tax=Klebsiella pneumoniae TaxID=573 RepID=A0A4P0YAP2_KLEPN|nr:AsmA protein [Klebsiella pneumoniae]